MYIKHPKLTQCFYVVFFFLIVTSLWELAVRFFDISTMILPPPSLIGNKLWHLVWGGDRFWDHYVITMHEVLLGYVVAILIALILGVAISQFRGLRLGLLPYVVAFQTVPTVALAPVILNWFGFGMASKVIMAALIAFFPMLLNVIAGLQASRNDQIQMLRSFGASHYQILLKVRIPNSLPFLFVALDLGIIFALIGAIVAEFQGAQKGLARMLLQYNEQFEIASMFAVLGLLSLTGVILHAIVGYIKKRIVFWNGE